LRCVACIKLLAGNLKNAVFLIHKKIRTDRKPFYVVGDCYHTVYELHTAKFFTISITKNKITAAGREKRILKLPNSTNFSFAFHINKTMNQLKIPLSPDEKEIDTWTILYIPPDGGKYNGKLTITNKRLLYDARFDVSAKGLLSETLFTKRGSEDFLEINKKDIKEVRTEKSLLSKKAILILTDGSKHTFNYGALNIDKVIAAINDR